jgi:hypothetical protein
MILKAIFDIIVFLIWRLPIGILKVISENMMYIYVYMYFGYGGYMVYHKQEITSNYLFLGMAVIVAFFVEYINKKTKIK